MYGKSPAQPGSYAPFAGPISPLHLTAPSRMSIPTPHLPAGTLPPPMPMSPPESHASFPEPLVQNESTAPLSQNDTSENQSAWLSNGPGETPDPPAASAQNLASPASRQ